MSTHAVGAKSFTVRMYSFSKSKGKSIDSSHSAHLYLCNPIRPNGSNGQRWRIMK